jgi:hypothetical protein
VPELIEGFEGLLGLLFIFSIVFAAVGLVIFIWKVFNITEKDEIEILKQSEAPQSDFIKDAAAPISSDLNQEQPVNEGTIQSEEHIDESSAKIASAPVKPRKRKRAKVKRK